MRAASSDGFRAITLSLAVMIGIIVATDQLIWRPAIAWSDKFKFEQVESGARIHSPLLHLFTHSEGLRMLRRHTLLPISESIYRSQAQRQKRRSSRARESSPGSGHAWLGWIALLVILSGVIYAAGDALTLLRQVTGPQLAAILRGAAATFLRMNVSLLLAAAWTIPAGVAIGFNPRLARIAQPLAQIAASVPATALFPLILLALIRVGGGMGIASIPPYASAAQP